MRFQCSFCLGGGYVGAEGEEIGVEVGEALSRRVSYRRLGGLAEGVMVLNVIVEDGRRRLVLGHPGGHDGRSVAAFSRGSARHSVRNFPLD